MKLIIREYSRTVFILSLIVSIFTFPIGIAVPLYFYIKSKRGKADEQTTLEIITVLIYGLSGIISVEFGGRTGAKIIILVSIVLISIILLIIIFFII